MQVYLHTYKALPTDPPPYTPVKIREREREREREERKRGRRGGRCAGLLLCE